MQQYVSMLHIYQQQVVESGFLGDATSFKCSSVGEHFCVEASEVAAVLFGRDHPDAIEDADELGPGLLLGRLEGPRDLLSRR